MKTYYISDLSSRMLAIKSLDCYKQMYIYRCTMYIYRRICKVGLINNVSCLFVFEFELFLCLKRRKVQVDMSLLMLFVLLCYVRRGLTSVFLFLFLLHLGWYSRIQTISQGLTWSQTLKSDDEIPSNQCFTFNQKCQEKLAPVKAMKHV